MFDDSIMARSFKQGEREIQYRTEILALERAARILRVMDDKGYGTAIHPETVVYSLTSCARSITALVNHLHAESVTLGELFDRLIEGKGRPAGPGAPVLVNDIRTMTPGGAAIPMTGSMLVITKRGKGAVGNSLAVLGEPWTCPRCEADTYHGVPGICGGCGHVVPMDPS